MKEKNTEQKNNADLQESPTISSHKTGILELKLSQIDEDPHQPRVEFNSVTLQELADTINTRGIKTPISVRPHPEKKNRFIINHGARRFRASKMAGKKTIPAYIDTDYTLADQVIENLQRDNLTPREIADYIGRELSLGTRKIDIAKKIGKSQAFVSQHVTLLDLPEKISALFTSGKVQDVTIINELVKAYKKDPEEVESWLDDEVLDITRHSIKLLRGYLKDKHDQDTIADAGDADTNIVITAGDGQSDDIENNVQSEYEAKPTSTKNVSTYKRNKIIKLFDHLYKNIQSNKNNPKITFDQLDTYEAQQLIILLNKLIK
jgi:ParB family transcriptional regulator, chromosome partitioning protein